MNGRFVKVVEAVLKPKDGISTAFLIVKFYSKKSGGPSQANVRRKNIMEGGDLQRLVRNGGLKCNTFLASHRASGPNWKEGSEAEKHGGTVDNELFDDVVRMCFNAHIKPWFDRQLNELAEQRGALPSEISDRLVVLRARRSISAEEERTMRKTITNDIIMRGIIILSQNGELGLEAENDMLKLCTLLSSLDSARVDDNKVNPFLLQGKAKTLFYNAAERIFFSILFNLGNEVARVVHDSGNTAWHGTLMGKLLKKKKERTLTAEDFTSVLLGMSGEDSFTNLFLDIWKTVEAKWPSFVTRHYINFLEMRNQQELVDGLRVHLVRVQSAERSDPDEAARLRRETSTAFAAFPRLNRDAAAEREARGEGGGDDDPYGEKRTLTLLQNLEKKIKKNIDTLAEESEAWMWVFIKGLQFVTEGNVSRRTL